MISKNIPNAMPNKPSQETQSRTQNLPSDEGITQNVAGVAFSVLSCLDNARTQKTEDML